MLADKIEGEQRVPQMVEHAHEDDDVETLSEGSDFIYVELRELDLLESQRFARQPGLREVALIAVDAEDAIGTTALHLDRIETGVAPDIQHAPAAKIVRQVRREPAEFCSGIIAEKMVRR